MRIVTNHLLYFNCYKRFPTRELNHCNRCRCLINNKLFDGEYDVHCVLHSMETSLFLTFLNQELRFNQPALPSPFRFIISSQLPRFSRSLKGKSNRSLASLLYASCWDYASLHYRCKHLYATVLRYQSEIFLRWKYLFLTRLNFYFTLLLFLPWPE